MLTICALWVIRSTIAAVNTGSPKISLQRSKERFVVIMVRLFAQIDFHPHCHVQQSNAINKRTVICTLKSGKKHRLTITILYNMYR